MFRVGLTGGIASGKTTVCHYFSALGIDIFDADDIAKELVTIDAPCYMQVLQHFGSEFLLEDRTLDRRKLRALIFSDANAKLTLESILHPAIQAELISRSNTSQSAYCILAIPLLVECKNAYPLERILVIDTVVKEQLQRLCKRDNIAIDTANMIIKQQSSRDDRLAIADDIIDNNSNLDTLKNQINFLHQHYLKLAT